MAGGALTLRDALLPAVDAIRGIPGILGMRLYTVAIVTRTWSGARVGLGTKTDVITGIKIDLGISQVKVTQVTQKDIIASGGKYTDQDLKVGPITPPYTGSSVDNDAITIFDPLPTGTPTEILFKVTGPDIPNGAYFAKIGQNVTHNYHYEFFLRRTGEVP